MPAVRSVSAVVSLALTLHAGSHSGPRWSAQLAVVPSRAGQHCFDSLASIQENVPYNTTDRAHVVVNIERIVPTTPPSSGPAGYVYVDRNGELWLQKSASYRGDLWRSLRGRVSAELGARINALNVLGTMNAVVRISNDELTELKAVPASGKRSRAMRISGCFSDLARAIVAVSGEAAGRP